MICVKSVALSCILGCVLTPFYSFAETVSPETIPEQKLNVAKPIRAEVVLPSLELSSQSVHSSILTDEKLRQDPNFVQGLLNLAIEKNQIQIVKKLVEIYRTFSQKDEILVKFADAKIAKSEEDYSTAINLYREILAEKPELNPVRIELAITLFLDKQDNAARSQFEKSLTEKALPQDIRYLISQYLQVLNQRDEWKFSFSTHYLQEDNVNNVSKAEQIENTTFIKGESMLPQKAHGIGYWVNIERDFNVFSSHYLHLENNLYGKNYWDNHQYDDITNRTYLGYSYKNSNQQWSLLPFYERQWYGNHRYKWGRGIRGELNYWLTPNWQISAATEFSKNQHHQSAGLNGNNKLISSTLLWLPIPQQFFFIGGDFSAERTQSRHYSYDLKTLRLGWGKEWDYGISSRLSTSISKREYKDNLQLGNVFYFSRARKDHIYNLNATLWKRDWHIWGITPKLNLNWKKQESNFSTLYSYIDRNINVLFEKTF